MEHGVIGGVGLTHLTVYEDRPAPDGLMSGCAHVHAVTEEAYYAIAGTGVLELHDLEHGFRRIPLKPGTYVHFSPGTLHRAVSTGGLEALVIIGNAGLAEHGDARIYFGAEADADPAAYARLAALPKTHGRDGALQRRDASVDAYRHLVRLWDSDRAAYRAEISRFVSVHARAMDAHRAEFRRIVEAGPLAAAQASLARIDGLPAAVEAPFGIRAETSAGEVLLGMCGTLRPVLPSLAA